MDERPCAVCGRPFIARAWNARYCPEHKGAGSKAEYGWEHQKRRKSWEARVAGGRVRCARCGLPITKGQAWDLGHVDGDPTRYSGPEHARCNRRTMSHRRRKPSRPPVAQPTPLARPVETLSLEERVPRGGVRCGACGWLIEAGHDWQLGEEGPEHVLCEYAPAPCGPPYRVRIWSQNWGRPR